MKATNVPHRDRLRDHPLAPVQEDDRDPARQDQPGQPAREVGQQPHRHQRPDEGVVLPPEPLLLSPLRVRRHRKLEPEDGLDQEAADPGAPLPQFGGDALEPPPVAHQRPQAGRQDREAHQEEAGIQPEQDPHRPQQIRDVSQPRQKALGNHALNLADVVVDARHDVADRGTRVEAGREPLQVPVQGQAHVEEDVPPTCACSAFRRPRSARTIPR